MSLFAGHAPAPEVPGGAPLRAAQPTTFCFRIAVCAPPDDGSVAALEVIAEDRGDSRVAQRDCPREYSRDCRT
jgi:hypothetical protein